MIKLKKENLIFTYGLYDLILEDHPQIYAYTRSLDDDQVVVIANLSENLAEINLKDFILDYEKLLLANYQVTEHMPTNSCSLMPFEARVYQR
jgi:alpha-glucosidase